MRDRQDRFHVEVPSSLIGTLPPIESRRAQDLVEVVRHGLTVPVGELLGVSCIITPYEEQGYLSYVYLVTDSGNPAGRWIVKLKDLANPRHQFVGARGVDGYLKEFAVLERGQASGYPCADPAGVWEVNISGVGECALLVESYLPYRSARHYSPHGERERDEPFIKALGAGARRLHGLGCSGFGPLYDFERGDFSQTWEEYAGGLLSPLRKADALSYLATELGNDRAGRLQTVLRDLVREQPPSGVIIHGDLNLGNILVTESGEGVALVDYEKSRGSVVEEEFARQLYEHYVLAQRYKERGAIRDIFRTNGGISSEFEAFLEGYGSSPDEFSERHGLQTRRFLLLFCANFWTAWETGLKNDHPDWGWDRPAGFAREAVEAILSMT